MQDQHHYEWPQSPARVRKVGRRQSVRAIGSKAEDDGNGDTNSNGLVYANGMKGSYLAPRQNEDESSNHPFAGALARRRRFTID